MDTVQIFDTTLRDGEQSPGFSMNREREAAAGPPDRGAGRGHPRSGLPDRLARRSRGDARRSRRNQALPGSGARARAPGGRRCGPARTRTCRQTPPAPLSRHFGPAPEAQAADHARAKRSTQITQMVALRPRSTAKRWNSPPKMPAAPTSTISARWFSRPSNAGATIINLPDTVGYSTPDEYAEMFRGVRARLAAHPNVDSERALPRRSGPGRGEFARGHRGGRAPDRVHHQRHRRARRKRVARGTGRGAARTAESLSV